MKIFIRTKLAAKWEEICLENGKFLRSRIWKQSLSIYSYLWASVVHACEIKFLIMRVNLVPLLDVITLHSCINIIVFARNYSGKMRNSKYKNIPSHIPMCGSEFEFDQLAESN